MNGGGDSPLGSLPSSEALQGMIGTLMSNPDLMKNILGVIGNLNLEEKKNDTEKSGIVPSTEQKNEETSPASTIPLGAIPPELMSKLPLILSLLGGGDIKPKSQSEINREALLCAMKPYLSPSRAETIEKIIKISRLGDLLGSL